MKKVFISHSSADKLFVRTLNDDLKSNGIDTWVDEEVMALGDNLDLQIRKGIKKADIFIIVLSDDSLNSLWVNNELNQYLTGITSSKKRFIPVVYKECKNLPGFISNYLYSDLSKFVRRIEGNKIKFTDEKEYSSFLELLIRSIRREPGPKNKLPDKKAGFEDLTTKIKIRFELVSEITSLNSSRDNTGMLNISPDNEIVPRLLYNHGSEEFDRKYYHSIWRWLRARSNKKFNQKFFDLLDKTSNLIQFNKEHHEFADTLIPSLEEFRTFNEYDKMLAARWLRYYVGQWDVQLRFTIDNTNNDKDILIISVIYDVKKIRRMKAILYSPQIKVFSYDLEHREGKQRFALAQQDKEIVVKKGKAISFDLVLRPTPESSVCPKWTGDIFIETNLGNIAAGGLSISTFNVHKGGILSKMT